MRDMLALTDGDELSIKIDKERIIISKLDDEDKE